jgi:hypothetical protein
MLSWRALDTPSRLCNDSEWPTVTKQQEPDQLFFLFHTAMSYSIRLSTMLNRPIFSNHFTRISTPVIVPKSVPSSPQNEKPGPHGRVLGF